MNDFIKNMSVILPSYKPDEKLLAVLDGLSENGFSDVIVVNDGSGSDYDEIFRKAAAYPNVTLLTHPENRGKGRALKTAFSYCLENRPSCTGVITVDGDNQHHPDDILACCLRLSAEPDKLVLGARNFSSEDVPLRSRLGNVITRNVFRFTCGIRITDTQTGLRAVSRKNLPLLTEIAGERYEYETNMLLEMKSHDIPLTEVAIRTIYLDENSSSHFNPLKDSIKIYRMIFAFLMSSLASSLVDLILFYQFVSYLTLYSPGRGDGWNTIIATTGARICSSLCNYLLNSKKVFRSKNKNSLTRYYRLCVLQFAASAALVTLFTSFLLGTIGSEGKTVIKAIVDIILFLISYRIQREWVFKK